MKPVVHVTRDAKSGYRITCTKLGFNNHHVYHAGDLVGAFCEEIVNLNAQLQLRDQQLQQLRGEAEKLQLFVAELQQLRDEVERQEKNTAPNMAHGARIPRASLMSEDDVPDQIKYTLGLPRKYKRRIRLVTQYPANSAKEFGYLYKHVDALEFHERVGRWQQLANACELDLVMHVEPQCYSFYGVPRREQH